MKLAKILSEQESGCESFESFAKANTYLQDTYTNLGSGDNGYAYKTDKGTVLKITRDLEEIEISKRIKGKGTTKHFVQIYKICEYGDYAIIEKDYAKPIEGKAADNFFDSAEAEIGIEIDPDTKGNLGVVDGKVKFFDY